MPVLIPLSQGRFAIVDDEDADLLAFKWTAWASGKTFYSVRQARKDDGKSTSLYLHRAIAARMGITGEVDHRNRHGLDCTRGNLRSATRQQNTANQGLSSRNASGAKGVSWDKRRGKWVAQISVNGKYRYLGRFPDLAGATAAARSAREEAFGEFACHGDDCK